MSRIRMFLHSFKVSGLALGLGIAASSVIVLVGAPRSAAAASPDASYQTKEAQAVKVQPLVLQAVPPAAPDHEHGDVIYELGPLMVYGDEDTEDQVSTFNAAAHWIGTIMMVAGGGLLAIALCIASWWVAGAMGFAVYKRLTKVYHLTVLQYWLPQLEKQGTHAFRRAEVKAHQP